MRLFLAIDLPDKLKERIENQIDSLKKEYGNFNWVPKENFHLTLHFIGEIETSQQVEAIKKRIEESIYDAEDFILYATGADLFINGKIIIYIGFRREKAAEDLVLKIQSVFGNTEYKKFTPHLTVAKAKIPSKQQYYHLKKKLARLPIDMDFAVHEIVLFESIPDSQKPIYKRIASFSLLKS